MCQNIYVDREFFSEPCLLPASSFILEPGKMVRVLRGLHAMLSREGRNPTQRLPKGKQYLH